MNTQSTPLVLIGICPLAAASTTLVRGFTIGMVTLAALTGTMLTVVLLRRLLSYRLRVPALLLISTTLVGIAQLWLQSWRYELSLACGIYLPLIAVNALLLARVEEAALGADRKAALHACWVTGTGLLLGLAVCGLVRELLAYGTILRDAELLLGPSGGGMTVRPGAHPGLALLAKPAGALLVLGLMAAALNRMRRA